MLDYLDPGSRSHRPNTFRKVIAASLAALTFAASAAMLTGCGNRNEIDTSSMYLVVYDGNGGYLGNKAAQVRKLFCQPGSKIPDYPVGYTDNQYTVPSLGLAMREGFQLLGWYSDASADYRPKEGGEFVLLSTEDGNGVYELNAEGAYVAGYNKDENGGTIFVYLQESSEETDSYILLAPKAAGTVSDTESPEESGEMDAPILTVDPGFYVCNDAASISEIDDDVLRAFYEEAFAEGTYTKAEAEALSGWQVFDDLPAVSQAKFESFERYSSGYREATEDDTVLDHYTIESAYASVYSLFYEDPNGAYVEAENGYAPFDPATGDGAVRYSLNARYVFHPTDSVKSPTDLTRYDASIEYWDFANRTVTEDDCIWDGEKYVLTLYANWVKKNTVYYHYENGTGMIDSSTTVLLPDNITYRPIQAGETIGRKEIVPKKSGCTFLGWSKSQDTYDPWNFATDVFPDDVNEIHLFAFFTEGEYTRIVSAAGLSAIGKDPSGKYLLADDIDLGGKEFTASPLGLTEDQVFTGEFIAGGHTLKNFTFKLAASKQQAADSNRILGAALFPNVCGATIEGLRVEDMTYLFSALNGNGVGDDSIGGKSTIRFAASGLIGTALPESDSVSGPTKVSGCDLHWKLDVKNAKSFNSSSYQYTASLGEYAVNGLGNLEISESSSESDDTAIPTSIRLNRSGS